MVAFTDAELAVLTQLAYQDINQVDEEVDYVLSAFLRDKEEYLREELGETYDSVIDGLIEKSKNPDYVIVKAENDKDGTGFAAMAIKDPDNEVTVACRGTEGFSFDYDSKKDVLTDAQIGVRVETNQQKKLEEFMFSLEKDDYSGYYFTGHSLGGNLASHGAISIRDSSKVKGVVTFNAPGFMNYNK